MAGAEKCRPGLGKPTGSLYWSEASEAGLVLEQGEQDSQGAAFRECSLSRSWP